MNRTKHRIQRTVQYKTQFNIDLRSEPIGQVFEVVCHLGNKFKVEVVDPRKQLVRVTSKGNENLADFVHEGNISSSSGRVATFSPFASLPFPKGITLAIIIEKMRRL